MLKKNRNPNLQHKKRDNIQIYFYGDRKLPLKSNLNEILGKQVNDPYGRYFGRIVGFDVNSKGEVIKIGIERAYGDFSIYPAKQIFFNEEGTIFTYAWKIKAQETLKELNLTLRKISALNQLLKNGEIAREFYDKNREEKELIVTNILKTRKNLTSPLFERIKKLECQVTDMQRYLTNLKIEHISEEIEDSIYKNACNMIQEAISRASTEKKDLEEAVQALMRPVSITPSLTNRETELLDEEKSVKQARPLVLRIKEAIS